MPTKKKAVAEAQEAIQDIELDDKDSQVRYRIAKTKNEEIKAALMEIELQKQRNEICYRAVAEMQMNKVFATFVTALKGLPVAVTRDANLNPTQRCVLKDAVDRILTQLSEVEIDFEGCAETDGKDKASHRRKGIAKKG